MTSRIVVLSTGDVVRRLGIQRYRLHYLLDTGRVAEPLLRVGGKRIWTEDEYARAAEVVAEDRAAKGLRPRRGGTVENSNGR